MPAIISAECAFSLTLF